MCSVWNRFEHTAHKIYNYFIAQEIFCKSCYGKLYGPKGYGYGAGAGTLSMDTGMGYAKNNAPLSQVTIFNESYIGGNSCGRCGGTVYTAEQSIASGLVNLSF